MRSIRKQIGDHPISAFFVGAYAITWGIWFPVLSAIDRGLIAYSTTALVVLVAGSFGPPLSAPHRVSHDQMLRSSTSTR
jgi:hypothetical protein